MRTALSIAAAGVILAGYAFFNFQVWLAWPLPLWVKIAATSLASAYLGFNSGYAWLWVRRLSSGKPRPQLVSPALLPALLFLSLAAALPVVVLMGCWKATDFIRTRRLSRRGLKDP